MKKAVRSKRNIELVSVIKKRQKSSTSAPTMSTVIGNRVWTPSSKLKDRHLPGRAMSVLQRAASVRVAGPHHRAMVVVSASAVCHVPDVAVP